MKQKLFCRLCASRIVPPIRSVFFYQEYILRRRKSIDTSLHDCFSLSSLKHNLCKFPISLPFSININVSNDMNKLLFVCIGIGKQQKNFTSTGQHKIPCEILSLFLILIFLHRINCNLKDK